MANKIDINSADASELTQLPGVSKDVAYKIVNWRKKHGAFTHWDELLTVRQLPEDKIDAIKERADLRCPAGEDCLPPRHPDKILESFNGGTRANTKRMRSTRRQKAMSHSPRKKAA